MRKPLEPARKRKFGIALEYVPGRAAEQTAKILQEHKAGVPFYDVFAYGGCGGIGLIGQDVLGPLEPIMIPPEVRDSEPID